MKVIDLLNKIANGEEVPEIIKYKNENLYFDYETTNYFNDEDMHSLFCGAQFILNDEVEIIEEDKDIEEISFRDIAISINETYNDNVDVLMNKINELIREVNKLKGKYE